MAYENFYQGASYALDADYGELFTGYRIPASQIGLATDPRTANQLQEASNKINPGGKVIEVSIVDPKIFESIPNQHLDEIRRLSKVTGTEVSLHGPAVEPSGYAGGGGGGLIWTEESRKSSEAQIMSAVERSHKLDSKGNIPVVFHPSYSLPEAEERYKENGKEIPKSMVIVDSRTGSVAGQLKEQPKYFPEYTKEGEKITKFNPQQELARANEESWVDNLHNLSYRAQWGEDILERTERLPNGEKISAETKQKLMELYSIENRDEAIEKIKNLPGVTKEYLNASFKTYDHANIYLRESYNSMRELYNRAYKEATKEDKSKLDAFAHEIEPLVKEGVGRDPAKLEQFSKLVEKGIKVLGSIKSPQLYKPLNNFLIDKTSDTFSNVAFHAYEKFGEKAPMISIENPPAGTALSRADDIKKLIEETRGKFVKRAKEKGYSGSEAERAAEKLIGATWDVGHINMLRRYGYDKADLVKETEKIAPFVKHVHLSDNFGFEHTEIPMGMGNVPLKDMMKKIGDKDIKKIVEAGNWYQYFQRPPLLETLEAAGSPLFAMKSPYWNQISGTYGNYSSGYGNMLPEQHFSLYGSGFSSLPTDLGGQIPGKQSRFSGTPTA